MISYRLFNTEQELGLPGTKDGVAVSSTNTYYSRAVHPGDAGAVSFQASWTGTPTGTITVWATDKPDADLSNDNDWIQVTDTLTDPAGSASKTRQDITCRATAVRLKYVNASGSGVLFAYANLPVR